MLPPAGRGMGSDAVRSMAFSTAGAYDGSFIDICYYKTRESLIFKSSYYDTIFVTFTFYQWTIKQLISQ